MEPSADDWRRRAACRNAKVEMVPADGDSAGLRRAKKLCAGCPVRDRCRQQAIQEATAGGMEAVWGVWGGLTEKERATMIGLGRQPAPCTRCGLDCVPIKLKMTKCAVCQPRAQIRYDDYRLKIERMVRDGCSTKEVAERLHLRREAVVSACARWKLGVAKRSSARQIDVMPCGTLAAKYRHHRRERYSWRDCPRCQFVPWNRGTDRKAAA